MGRRSEVFAVSTVVFSLALEAILAVAGAQTPPLPAQMQGPLVSPEAVPSLAPADQPTTLPYPAYGTPVPGVRNGVKIAGVPHIITLKAAVDLAVALSPSLAAARADVGVAAAEVRLARAGLLPALAGSLGSTHEWYSNRNVQNGYQNSFQSTSSSVTNQQFNSGSLSLNQLIFDGGRTAAGIRAAKATETAAVYTYQRTLQTLAYNVASAYYATLQAERTTQVDAELVRENQVQYALVLAQYRAGTAAYVDVVTAEVPVAQARVAVVQAQGNEVAAQAAFANTLGVDANANVRPKDDTPVFRTSGLHTIAIPPYQTAMLRAQNLRPDLAASQANIDAARADVRQAKLGLFPTLSGSASQGYASTTLGGGNYTGTTSLGATLSFPLFDQGQTPARTAQARANLDLAQANYQTTLLGVQLNVRQTLAQLISAREAVSESQVALDESQTVLKATQAQYRAGVTTLPQLLNAQVSLTQALTSQVTTVYALRQAEQAFLYAVGENTL